MIIDLCGCYGARVPLGRILNTKPSSFPFSFSLAGLESQALSKDLTEEEKRQLCGLLPVLMDLMAFKGTKLSLSFHPLGAFPEKEQFSSTSRILRKQPNVSEGHCKGKRLLVCV